MTDAAGGSVLRITGPTLIERVEGAAALDIAILSPARGRTCKALELSADPAGLNVHRLARGASAWCGASCSPRATFRRAIPGSRRARTGSALISICGGAWRRSGRREFRGFSFFLAVSLRLVCFSVADRLGQPDGPALFGGSFHCGWDMVAIYGPLSLGDRAIRYRGARPDCSGRGGGRPPPPAGFRSFKSLA